MDMIDVSAGGEVRFKKAQGIVVLGGMKQS